MTSPDRLLAWALTVLILVTVPGPSVLFTISRALTVSRGNAVLTVAGNALGSFVQVVAVAFGAGVLVERSATAFTVVKYVGAAYIAYLGVQAFRHRRDMREVLGQQVSPVGPVRSVWDGCLVGMTNPKSIAFFVVALPEFVNRSAGHADLQMLVLGALFPVLTLFVTSGWAYAAGTARAWFARSPRRLEMVGGAGGLVMVGLGVSLALTGRRD